MAELDSNGNWTDYIYGNGQKIARVAGAMPVLQMKGHRDPATNYMGCGVSTAIDNIAALSAQLGPIQPGDVFAFDLREPVTDSGITAQGGIGVWTNGAGITTSTTSGLTPWNDTVATGAWQHMVVPIGQAVPGETLTTLDFDMQNGTPAGDYELDYANVVIARANGTIIPVFTGQPVTFSLAGGGGELSANPVTACGATNLTAVVSSLPVDASVGTNYYLDDHLGTTQMELSSGGWPVWSGAFTPFGQEIINGTTTNYIGAQPADGTAMRYKFTGKERDAESGLDYFGARYYGSSMGRFMSPDWGSVMGDSIPDPVPYADFTNPQSLNLYTYGYNNPLSNKDADGHNVSICDNNNNCHTVSNEDYQKAQQGNNGSLNVPSLNQVGMNGNGSGQFNATNITDANGNSVGTATYISNGGADYYANRTGIDFINTQTAPVVNTMAGITIGAVGFIGGAEIAAAAPEAGGLIQQAGAYRRFLSLRSAWTALSKATGAAGLIGTFFKTGQVPPGLTPEMMQSYLSLARAYIAAGLGGDAGLAEQTSRAEQLSQYLGK